MDESVIDKAVYAQLQDTTVPSSWTSWWTRSSKKRPACWPSFAARAENHADRFRRAAHSLKPNSNTFGAMRLGVLARDLELKGLDADPARDTAAIIAALEVEYTRAASALKDLRNG